MKPPLTPEGTLRRVLWLARFEGRSLVIIAGLAAVVALLMGDLVGLTVCVLIVYAGRTALKGRELLVRGDIDGMRRLKRAELLVLNVVVVYCLRVIAAFDVEATLAAATQYNSLLGSLEIDPGPVLALIRAKLPMVVYATYGLVALLTVLLQGGLWLYYRRSTGAVRQALTDRRRPVVPSAPPTGAAPEDLVT